MMAGRLIDRNWGGFPSGYLPVGFQAGEPIDGGGTVKSGGKLTPASA